MYYKFLLLPIYAYLLVSCTSVECRAKQNANYGGNNQVEISKFLDHYKQLEDREKYQAACFLIANMTNKYSYNKQSRRRIHDIQTFCADSMILSLEHSFALRTQVGLQDYSFDDFCEYILPYRVANEPAEYYWKRDIPRWIRLDMQNANSLITKAKSINQNIHITTAPDVWGNPQMGYTATMKGRLGKCDDRAILVTMAMRSLGVPAAFEFVPNWGGKNNGHSFCSVILPENSVRVFQDINDDGENILLSQKAPKIYRTMFSEQKNTLVYKYRDTEPIPSLFKNHNLLDVTAMHDIGQRQMTVPIQIETSNKIIYLSVFTPREWIPVAYTENKGKYAVFRDVGNGAGQHGGPVTQGENIGEGIVYLPVICADTGVVPASYPVIVSADKMRVIKPQTATETIRISRKYPRLTRVVRFAEQMIGGVFEGANNRDFSDAIVLHQITTTPLSRMQRVDIPFDKPMKYLRYRKPAGTLSLGEMVIYDNSGTTVQGKLIASDIIASDTDLVNICDNNPLTYYELSGCVNLWAGVAFDQPRSISKIEFCPRNDDNEVTPGDKYELFYWDNGWVGLGTQTATDLFLEYTDVPRGSLLWLRNLTKGREERPFTYENNTQIWW